MANLLLILVCLVSGILLRVFRILPLESARTLNIFVLYISLPALILVHIPALLAETTLGFDLLIPVSMAWIHIALAMLFIIPIGKARNWSPARIGALTLTAGLGNTSYVGFPLLTAFLGPPGVQVGVLVDQLGSFLTVSTLGLVIAAHFSGRGLPPIVVIRRVVFFPPFVALMVSLIWYASGLYSSESIFSSVFQSLAITLVPLALVSVGLQIRVNADILSRRWKDLTLGLSFKLILAPIILAAIYLGLAGGAKELILHATILEAAMPPMITSAIVAQEYNLDSEIANLMVGVGIPVGILTVPAWDYIIRTFLL